MPPFILILHGPWCAGKTTVIKLLFARHKRLFLASRDEIVWLISDYHVDKNRADPLIDETVSQVAAAVLQNNFGVVVEAGSMFRARRQQLVYQSLAEQYQVPLFQVNIEAPFDVLSARFSARLLGSEAPKSKNVDHSMMKERYDVYMAHRDASAQIIDSSRLSENEIIKFLQQLTGLPVN